jgi:hypothetical protein
MFFNAVFQGVSTVRAEMIFLQSSSSSSSSERSICSTHSQQHQKWCGGRDYSDCPKFHLSSEKKERKRAKRAERDERDKKRKAEEEREEEGKRDTCHRPTSHGYWIDEKFHRCLKVHIPVHPGPNCRKTGHIARREGRLEAGAKTRSGSGRGGQF